MNTEIIKKYNIITLSLVFSLCILSLNALVTELVYPNYWIGKIPLRIISLFIFILIVMYFRSMSKLYFIVTFSFALIGLVTLNPDYFAIVYILIAASALSNLNDDELITIGFNVSLFILLLIFTLLILGVTENEIRVFRERMTFGLNGIGGPTLFCNFFFGFASLACLKFKDNFYIFLLLFILNIYIYIETDTKGAFISLLVMFLVFFNWGRVFNKLISNVTSIFPIIALFFTLAIALFFNDYQGNKLFSYRPALINNALNSSDFFHYIFGRSIKELDMIAIVDSSYMHFFMGFGVVFYIFYSVAFFFAVNQYLNQSKIAIVVFFLSVSMYSIIESLLVRPENIFILIFWSLLMKKIINLKGEFS